jgi:hypothetical protein
MMSEFYVSGDRLSEALADLKGAPADEIAEVVAGVADRVIDEHALAVEQATLDVVADLSGRVEQLRAEIEDDRRALVQPEVDRYLRLRDRRASIS